MKLQQTISVKARLLLPLVVGLVATGCASYGGQTRNAELYNQIYSNPPAISGGNIHLFSDGTLL
jgi:hypothetical protein